MRSKRVREGFETVLFLQSLQVSAGTATVVEGAALGPALTFAVGAVTFLLQRKLPYKRMLVVTGVLIGFASSTYVSHALKPKPTSETKAASVRRARAAP